ncbi:MAG: VOC family protein [Hyphomonadaceae bacterium]
MAIIEQLGYVAIGVKDLDEAVDLYTHAGRMVEVERHGNTAFLTAGKEHHWLRLEQGDKDEQLRVGYDTGTLQNLRAAIEVLKKWKLPYEEVEKPNGEHVAHRVRFKDPGGMTVDLFYGMEQLPAAPNNHGVNIKKILHAGWRTPNTDETFKFWSEGLGFKVSDQIESGSWFMRCGDRYHHSLLLIRGQSDRPEFHHLCFLVDNIDDVMRIRNNGLRYGATLAKDVLKHTPSGSISVYFQDKVRNLEFEYCFDHAQLEDDHKPRVLSFQAGIGDLWKAELPDAVL